MLMKQTLSKNVTLTTVTMVLPGQRHFYQNVNTSIV